MASSLWIVWTIIGIIGGYMAGRLLPCIRSVAFAVCRHLRSYSRRQAFLAYWRHDDHADCLARYCRRDVWCLSVDTLCRKSPKG